MPFLTFPIAISRKAEKRAYITDGCISKSVLPHLSGNRSDVY